MLSFSLASAFFPLSAADYCLSSRLVPRLSNSLSLLLFLSPPGPNQSRTHTLTLSTVFLSSSRCALPLCLLRYESLYQRSRFPAYASAFCGLCWLSSSQGTSPFFLPSSSLCLALPRSASLCLALPRSASLFLRQPPPTRRFRSEIGRRRGCEGARVRG